MLVAIVDLPTPPFFEPTKIIIEVFRLTYVLYQIREAYHHSSNNLLLNVKNYFFSIGGISLQILLSVFFLNFLFLFFKRVFCI